MKEGRLGKEVQKELKKAGFFSLPFEKHAGTGWPNLMIIRDNVILPIELRIKRKKNTVDQILHSPQNFITDFLEDNFTYIVIMYVTENMYEVYKLNSPSCVGKPHICTSYKDVSGYIGTLLRLQIQDRQYRIRWEDY